jgi:hypothetical protein
VPGPVVTDSPTVKRFSLLPLSLALVAVAAAPAAARPSPSVDVLATGLDNPRGLTVTDNGIVLVTEAGTGGKGPCAGGPEGQFCLGATGAVTVVQGHRQQRIATGLPSLANPKTGETIGPSDIVQTDSAILVTLGLANNPSVRAQLGPGGRLLGHLVRLVTGSGARSVADIAGYEAAANPDRGAPPDGVDSNPYGLAGSRNGDVLVADAGGNDVVRVDKRGTVSTVAVLPAVDTPAPPPPGGPGGSVPMQAVPTTVVRGPDGAYYVGQLTGFPYPVGGAKVWRVVPGKAPTVYADNLTNVVDIAFDQRGRLLVVELAKNGLLSGDSTGALLRIGRDGRRTELATGRLTAPTAVGVGRDGTLYVSNKGVQAGGGEVLALRDY